MSRSTIYTHRGRTPRNCYTCDGITRCRCDRVTMRAAKRSAKQRWRSGYDEEIEEYLDTRFHITLDGRVTISWLDYAPCAEEEAEDRAFLRFLEAEEAGL